MLTSTCLWPGRTAVVVASLLLAAASPPAAQAPAKPGSFEVASIKLSASDDGGLNITFVGNPEPGGRWTTRNATLEQIIRASYPGHALANQLVGAPGWIRTTRFDISARAANQKASREELTTMARALLADRFKLATHTETHDGPGYALVLARPGAVNPKLRRAVLDCNDIRDAMVRKGDVPASSATACRISIGQMGPQLRLQAGGIDMTRLAALLTPRVGSPVVNATGLKGQFDVTLEFSTDPNAQSAIDPVSVFTAVQEQLGLRLDRRSVPIEVLVIDHVERPQPD